MSYVEWLRVRGCLKWTAIVLVVCVAFVLFARFTFLEIRPNQHGFSGIFIGSQDLADFERGSNQTQTKLRDGTFRTVIDNAVTGTRITIDDHGYWGKHVEIFEKKPPAGVHPTKIGFADIHAQRLTVPGGSLVKIDTGALVPEDLDYYFIMAAIVALIVATILGAPFARENEGHLELALTKPISRINLALQTIASDFAGIVAAWVMTVIFLIIGHTIFEAPNYTYGPTDTVVLVVGLLGAFSWYALLNASTASMKRAYGGVLGTAWPVAIGLSGIAHAPLGDSPLADFIRWVGTTLSWLFPITYLHFASISGIASREHSALTTSPLPPEAVIVILAVLALVYGAAAIYQWRRVEA